MKRFFFLAVGPGARSGVPHKPHSNALGQAEGIAVMESMTSRPDRFSVVRSVFPREPALSIRRGPRRFNGVRPGL